MINALEAVIQYVKASGLSTTQVASKERYGELWQVSTSSIVINLDGGDPDIYLPVQSFRLEVRCYGQTRYHALELLDEFILLSRQTSRERVVMLSGTALLYTLIQESGPSTLYDENVGMDFALQFYVARVSELAIP